MRSEEGWDVYRDTRALYFSPSFVLSFVAPTVAVIVCRLYFGLFHVVVSRSQHGTPPSPPPTCSPFTVAPVSIETTRGVLRCFLGVFTMFPCCKSEPT